MSISNASEKVLYTAKVRTTGGRQGGAAISTDGRLDIELSVPGSPGAGTNPEQLFAAGWSACFEGAIAIAARKLKVQVPAEMAIDAEVDLCVAHGSHFLRARMIVSLPGISRDLGAALVELAHEICPYSKATRGNLDVRIDLAGSESDSAVVDARASVDAAV